MPIGINLDEMGCWPDVLRRAEELVAEGLPRYRVSALISAEFKISRDGFDHAILRGDVPALPSSDLARVTARRSGHLNFKGKPCVACGSTVRLVSDGVCVACDHERQRRYREQMSSRYRP